MVELLRGCQNLSKGLRFCLIADYALHFYNKKWPGLISNSNGTEWICGICGGVANAISSPCLRQAVTHYHTVGRCADGVLKFQFRNLRTLATRNAETQGHACYSHFLFMVEWRVTALYYSCPYSPTCSWWRTAFSLPLPDLVITER
jgi:hypothetical protein